LPLAPPLISAGALTLQVNVVPAMLLDSDVLNDTLEHCAAVAGMADTEGLGFTVIV
jgi:hypothetical protein